MSRLDEELRELRRTLGKTVDLSPNAMRVLVEEKDPWTAYRRAAGMQTKEAGDSELDLGSIGRTKGTTRRQVGGASRSAAGMPGKEARDGELGLGPIDNTRDATRRQVGGGSRISYLIPLIGLGFAGVCTVEAVRVAVPVASQAALSLSLLAALTVLNNMMRKHRESPRPTLPPE